MKRKISLLFKEKNRIRKKYIFLEKEINELKSGKTSFINKKK
jgi:hypothetical protein